MFNKYSEEFADDMAIDLDGDGSLVETKKPQTRKYPNAPKVYDLFEEVLGKRPSNWKINKNQLTAAENLYTERGLDKIRNALQFAKEHHDEKYCPKINSPYDLDSKYTELGEYKLSL